MRTYYAIYIYYYTYDITWYAFYAWFWTALEADLGIMCASAPALKVFLRRYFSLPTNRSSKSGLMKNSGPWNSIGKFKVDNSRHRPDIVPMDCIKVSTCHRVTIEDQEEMLSHASDMGIRTLTALPSSVLIDKSNQFQWAGCRTVCAAIRPDSARSSRNEGSYTDMTRCNGSD